jgi:hypothetical protein
MVQGIAAQAIGKPGLRRHLPGGTQGSLTRIPCRTARNRENRTVYSRGRRPRRKPAAIALLLGVSGTLMARLNPRKRGRFRTQGNGTLN